MKNALHILALSDSTSLLFSSLHPLFFSSSSFSRTSPALVLPGLYPNLEDLGNYMGLALNSDEIQKNLALLPVAENVRPRFIIFI